MEQSQMRKRIRRLAREKSAIIIAHNYQRYEVQQAADLVGDSLGLSAMKCTPAKTIIRASVSAAFAEIPSESPTRSAACCTS